MNKGTYADSPLSGFSLVIATLFVSIGTLLISLDQFIANVSIPSIVGDLGTSKDDGTWIITSYVIANAIVVPLTGWLTNLVGRVKLFATSAILFSVMSLLCGMAISFKMLIFFRILQGLVSGSLIPLSQALLVFLFPKKRSFALGIWGLVVMVGPALGPVLGGWLTYTYTWNWIFYINVPLGLLAGIITYIFLIPFESAKRKDPIDSIGIFLLVIMVTSFQVMLDRGADDNWFQSSFITFMAVLSFISFCFFLVWEFFHPYPIVDLSFFKNINFSLGTFMLSVSMFLLFGSLIVGPIWVQQILGYTPLWAGFSIAFLGASAFFVFPLVGIYLPLMDARIWAFLGWVIFIPPTFYMAYLPIWTSFFCLAFPRFFQGIGFATFYVALTTLALSGISQEKMPSAAGIFTFVRTIFLSMGVALFSSHYIRRESFFHSRYVEYVIPANPQFKIYYDALDKNLHLTGRAADAYVANMVTAQAFTEVFLELSYLSAWIFVLLSICFVFFRVNKKGKPVLSD